MSTLTRTPAARVRLIPSQSSTGPVVVVTAMLPASEASTLSPKTTSTPRSKSLASTSCGPCPRPKTALTPSRRAPIHPSPAKNRTPTPSRPATVRTSPLTDCTSWSVVQMPSPDDRPITVAPKVRLITSATPRNRSVRPSTTSPNTVNPRASAGNSEKKAKNAIPPASTLPRTAS